MRATEQLLYSGGEDTEMGVGLRARRLAGRGQRTDRGGVAGTGRARRQVQVFYER